MIKKPDSLCTSKMIFALSLGLCFLGITSALTIPNKNAEHKPFFEGIKIVVSGDNNNEKVEKTGANNILLFNNGIATISNIGDNTGDIQDYINSYSSLFGGSENHMIDSKTAVIFGGEDNTITSGGDYAYIIGGQKQDITNTEPTYYIGGTNNGFSSGDANNDHGIFIGGQDNEYIGENKNYISIIANNDTKVTKENSLLIHNNNTTNKTTIKNTFFYNNQENNAKNDNAAEFYSENGLQINTASSVSGITINAGGSFQMVPKDINNSPMITTTGSCNANNNGLYEVVNSGGDICVFYCNGHDWKDAFPGEVRYTGTNGNIETRSDQRKCNEWPTTKSKGDCVISGGMTIANGMTAELYRGDYPKCEKFIGTCKNGKIQDEDKEDVNAKQLRHICEAATGRCQATTEQREKQLIDENAIPCTGINFTIPGNKDIVLTGQCPSSNTMNTKYTNECLYTCKEGYKPYDSGSGTKCEEVFKIVFTGTSVTTGEIIFAGRKEAKSFIYSGQNRTGYTFTGWKNFSTTDAINTKGKFKRKGDGSINGGTEVDSGNVEYYYNTMGDFDDKYHLTGEYILTLSGLWEPNTYTINFNLDGGEGLSTPKTCHYDNIQYIYDSLYKLTSTPPLYCDISKYNTPTKTGYTFVGWEIQGMDDKEVHYLYSDSNCATLFAAPTTTGYNDFSIHPDDGREIKCVKNLTAQKKGSITFIAHWRPNKLIVNYYGNGADYAYVKGNDWTQFPDSYHVPIIKKQDLIPEENNYHKIPNPQTGYYDSPIHKDYPYDYRTWSFSLTRSGFQGSGTYDVYLGTTKVATIYQDIAKFKERDEIYVQEFAKEINVLSALEKWDTTVSLYAGWEKCSAGSYCPANQEPQKCTVGSYSNTGVSSCTACQSGATSIEGSMSCGTTCLNTAHVKSWKTASWNSNNTVKDLCTIDTCDMGYEKNETECKPKTYKITYNLNGGRTQNETGYTIETPEFTLNNPTKTGYIFLGWTGSNGKDPQITVQIPKGSTGNKTYYATWEPIKYKVKYCTVKSEYGACDNGWKYINVQYDQTVTIPNRSKAGYIWNGWEITGQEGLSKDTQFKNLTTTDGAIITFTPKYTAKQYKIHFYRNGGSIKESIAQQYARPGDGDSRGNENTSTSFTINKTQTIAFGGTSDNGTPVYIYRTFGPGTYQCRTSNFYDLEPRKEHTDSCYTINDYTEIHTPESFNYDDKIDRIYNMTPPYQEGYIFDGWYTYPQMSIPIYGVNSGNGAPGTIGIKTIDSGLEFIGNGQENQNRGNADPLHTRIQKGKYISDYWNEDQQEIKLYAHWIYNKGIINHLRRQYYESDLEPIIGWNWPGDKYTRKLNDNGEYDRGYPCLLNSNNFTFGGVGSQSEQQDVQISAIATKIAGSDNYYTAYGCYYPIKPDLNPVVLSFGAGTLILTNNHIFRANQGNADFKRSISEENENAAGVRSDTRGITLTALENLHQGRITHYMGDNKYYLSQN